MLRPNEISVKIIRAKVQEESTLFFIKISKTKHLVYEVSKERKVATLLDLKSVFRMQKTGLIHILFSIPLMSLVFIYDVIWRLDLKCMS